MKELYYIGLDVHKKQISYVIKTATGRQVAVGQVEATRAAGFLGGAIRAEDDSREHHSNKPAGHGFSGGIGEETAVGIFPETEAGGVSVTFDGIPAPLFHVVGPSNQINVFAPTELPEMGEVEVVLTTEAGESVAFLLERAATATGIFRIEGTSFAAATLHDTRWLPIPDAVATQRELPTDCAENEISPLSYCGRPIRPGEILDLYLTGLGKATPGGAAAADPLPTGSVAPADANPLYNTVMAPQVTIGGLPAEVIFSGLSPGFAGLYQINLFVPSGVEAGDEVEVTVTMPNGATDAVSIAVQE